MEAMRSTFGSEPNERAILFGYFYGSGGPRRRDANFWSEDFILENVVSFGLDGYPWWLRWGDVKDVGRKLKLRVVPEIGMIEAKNSIRLLTDLGFLGRIQSRLSEPRHTKLGVETDVADGIVGRSRLGLLDRRGQPIMWQVRGANLGVTKRTHLMSYAI